MTATEPTIPADIPPELADIIVPPPASGLPFNAQPQDSKRFKQFKRKLKRMRKKEKRRRGRRGASTDSYSSRSASESSSSSSDSDSSDSDDSSSSSDDEHANDFNKVRIRGFIRCSFYVALKGYASDCFSSI